MGLPGPQHAALLLAVALFVVIAATAYGQIRLNSWNQPFYDALSRRDIPRFLVQLGVFAIIAGALLALNVAQQWLGEMLKLKLRQGLVQDLVQNWLVPVAPFVSPMPAPSASIPTSACTRMHATSPNYRPTSGSDCCRPRFCWSRSSECCGRISSGFVFHVAGRTLAIPGYMVWAAVIYAGSASLLSYWVGRSLIERNAERYAREAELRFSLVRVNEHIDAIALAGGEAEEARRIELDLAAFCWRCAGSSRDSRISPGSPPDTAGSPSWRRFSPRRRSISRVPCLSAAS